MAEITAATPPQQKTVIIYRSGGFLAPFILYDTNFQTSTLDPRLWWDIGKVNLLSGCFILGEIPLPSTSQVFRNVPNGDEAAVPLKE